MTEAQPNTPAPPTTDVVVQMIEDRKAGMSYPDVGAKHGVSAAVVRYHAKKALEAGRVTAEEINWHATPKPLRYSPAEYDDRWVKRVVQSIVVDEKGCWLWQKQLTSGMGYGQLDYRHKNVSIHRKMYEVTRKVILDRKQYVCHSCDTPACCNPAHLVLGDHTFNQRDCVDKGRNYEARRTECERGHPLSGDNVRVGTQRNGTSPRRTCIACEKLRASSLEYKAKALERQRRRRAQQRSQVSI